MVACCVVGCKNRWKKDHFRVKFYRFPNDRRTDKRCALTAERSVAWLNAINRKDLKLATLKYTNICSEHFITGTPAALTDKFNPDWVPSMKLGYPTCQGNSNCSKRRKLSSENDPLAEAEIIPFETVSAEDDSFEPATHTCEYIIKQLQKQLAEKDELLKEYKIGHAKTGTADGYVVNLLKHKLDEKDALVIKYQEEHTETMQFFEKLLTEKNETIEKLKLNEDVQKVLLDSYEKRDKSKNETIEKLKLNEEIQQKAVYAYEEKLKYRDKLNDDLRKQILKQHMSVESFKDNDAKVNYFTGLPKFAIMKSLFDYVKGDLTGVLRKGVNVSEAFIMVLLKLRLDLPFTYLSYKYGMSLSTVSKIFNINLKAMSTKIGTFIRWPDKTAMKSIGCKFTAIISFFEISVEAPGPSLVHSEVLPALKNQPNTMKYLIAISPTGGIIYASKGYDGKCSEKSIVDCCGFLDNVENGDIILSDNGKTVNQLVVDNGAKLLIPIFRTSEDIEDIQMTKQMIKVRRHVEHLLRQKYLILSSRNLVLGHTKKKDSELYYDHIARLCCALANLCPSIIKAEKT